jgi:putative Mn2+ efflux pump MntP
MKKLLEKLKDLRVLLAIAALFMLPAFVCSIALGYVPEVTLWLMLPSAIIGAYFFIFQWARPIGGWIIGLFKK